MTSEHTNPTDKIKEAIGMGPVFHAKEGWRFARVREIEDSTGKELGSVVIMPPGDATPVIIDSGTWRSVVASVSSRGETSETWRLSSELHEGVS